MSKRKEIIPGDLPYKKDAVTRCYKRDFAIHLRVFWMLTFRVYLGQCYLLYNLHSLQKVIHRRKRETTRRTIPRTPSRRRERRQKLTHLNRSPDTLICPIIHSVAPPSVYKPHTTHNSSIRSDEGLTLETSAFESLYGG